MRARSTWREQIDSLGVSVYEHAGVARFVDPHTIETTTGLRLQAEKVHPLHGRNQSAARRPRIRVHEHAQRRLEPDFGAGVDAGDRRRRHGAQVASVFNAFGSRVQLFHRGPRILPTEDDDISAAVASAFRGAGIVVKENFGEIESFEKTPSGVRMNYCQDGDRNRAEASLAVVAVGWQANTAGLNLTAAGVETDARGFVRVDPYLRTSAPHIFAAGDVTGRLLLVPPAIQDGFVAATNAVRGPTMTLGEAVNPIGSFTDPEYAQVGLTESQARAAHDVVASTIHFDATTRTIIDGRTFGFCKLIVDRATHKILGCHVVGERAVEITQVAAIAITAGMRVDELAHVPLSFPTYAGILGRVAASVTRQLNRQDFWQTN